MNMMDQRMVKQMIGFQKATFDNTFGTISMLQDQAEKATKIFFESSVWPLPEEGKKVLDEWIQSFKKGRDEFKKTMDGSFKRVEEFFGKENPKAD